MRKACAWLLALALCGAGNATAALRLKLDAPGLDPAQREASQQLLDDAADKLPPAFRERLDREIEVEWRDDLPANGMGQARGPQRIALNRKYLADLTDGSAASRQTGRVHGTERRELLATLLHELTHVYDRARLWSAEEKREIRRCTRQEETLGRIAQPTDCRGQSGRRFTLSDDPRLLDLAGWPQRAGQRGRREAHNGFVLRSPDVYELSNPREFVAVNMEYFLLDPSYACRRPALYRYYQQRFGWAPEHSACAQSFAYLNAGRDFGQQPLGQLDPERVYEVDYLLAEANDNLVSRWGHTMLRLVICAPGRPRGPDCRLDLDQHLVLSYRAFVGDLQLSSWDGLTGAYPSRLFVLPLSQVIEEYTKVELRSLASVPLKLDREEVASLVERAAQSHWSYDGQYYFISNNCAVETLKLLRSGIPGDRCKAWTASPPTACSRCWRTASWPIPVCSTTPRKPCAWATASTPSATATRRCSTCSSSACTFPRTRSRTGWRCRPGSASPGSPRPTCAPARRCCCSSRPRCGASCCSPRTS